MQLAIRTISSYDTKNFICRANDITGCDDLAFDNIRYEFGIFECNEIKEPKESMIWNPKYYFNFRDIFDLENPNLKLISCEEPNYLGFKAVKFTFLIDCQPVHFTFVKNKKASKNILNIFN